MYALIYHDFIGTCKIPPLIVGTAKNPHCFRDKTRPCPLPYMNQSSAWVDKEIYRKWWHEVFLPAIRRHTDQPVALLMDNFSGHDVFCVDPLGQVKFLDYLRFILEYILMYTF